MKTVREDSGLPGKKPLSLLSAIDLIPLANPRQRKAALAELCTAAQFEKLMTWTHHLIQGLRQTGCSALPPAEDLNRLDDLEKQVQRQSASSDGLEADQVSGLIQVNKRLQLEMLERDLAEQQVFRKSKLLEAINQVLNQMVANRSEHSLAATCLRAVRELTASPFGFIVENQEGCWRVLAMASDAGRSTPDSAEALASFPMNNFWRELMQIGEARAFSAPGAHPLWRPLPGEFPEIRTLLVVPLPVKAGVPGFIALANNPHGYAATDPSDVKTLADVEILADVETLALSFVEALQRLRAEQAKQISERRLQLALDSAEEGLWDYQVPSHEIFFSPRWFTLLGYQAGELPSSFKTWTVLTHPDDAHLLKHTIRAATQSGEEAFKIEIRMLAQEGQWRWIQVRGRAVERDAKGVAVRLVGTLIDISRYKHVETALQKANDELQRLAALDDLTQIANRRRFDERLNDEWRRARRDGASLGLIIADIDYFKAYNDSYGHVRGDEILYAVAQAISASLKRPMDMVARYGGEEFAILLPNTDLHGAARVAQEISNAIHDLKIKHRASRVGEHVTLSFGVASVLPEGAAPAKSIVESADRALYKAKALGRDHIVAPGMDAACLRCGS